MVEQYKATTWDDGNGNYGMICETGKVGAKGGADVAPQPKPLTIPLIDEAVKAAILKNLEKA